MILPTIYKPNLTFTRKSKENIMLSYSNKSYNERLLDAKTKAASFDRAVFGEDFGDLSNRHSRPLLYIPKRAHIRESWSQAITSTK